MKLDHLARLGASPHSTGTLSFLIEEGIAQMAINLPLFQHPVVKCGEGGVMLASHQTELESERGNIHERHLVSDGSENRDIIVLQYFAANHLQNRFRGNYGIFKTNDRNVREIQIHV